MLVCRGVYIGDVYVGVVCVGLCVGVCVGVVWVWVVCRGWGKGFGGRGSV